MARYIQEPEENVQTQIKAIEDFEVSLIKPRNFDSSDINNDIKKVDESFENVCSMLEDLGIFEPHKLTVHKFLSKIRYFNKKFKAK